MKPCRHGRHIRGPGCDITKNVLYLLHWDEVLQMASRNNE